MGNKVLLLIALLFCTSRIYAQLQGFSLSGNPESNVGAQWTYQATVNGVEYDLEGILYKPAGSSKMPAVIISHGTGGSIKSYSRQMAAIMVQWGFVCIATNYTHAGGVPIGAPGSNDVSEYGASKANILRAMKCWDILASLSYVDTSCIAAFGHSRGAFITTAITGLYPDKFRVAGHSAGGVSDQEGSTAPSSAIAGFIKCPYIIHHGDIDQTVVIQMDQRLDEVLKAANVTHQFYTYQGYSHSAIAFDSVMLARTKAWFDIYRCGSGTNQPAGEPPQSTKLFTVYSNPAASARIFIKKNDDSIKSFNIRVTDMKGRIVFTKTASLPIEEIQMHNATGVYVVEMWADGKREKEKLIIPAK